jgi:hypothetical protein
MTVPTTKRKSMFNEVKNDITTFVSEYRGVFYFIALAFLADHFIFRGIFRDRLQAMADKMVKKVEEKIQ